MKQNINSNFIPSNYMPILNETIMSTGSKIFIGDEETSCRFCGRSHPDVSFKNVSHAIPEFIGNKRFILKSECDTCNNFFSKNLEVHLDKYTKPYRIIAKIKGKNRIPNYKSKDKKTRINSNGNDVAHIISPSDSKFINIIPEKNTITNTYELEAYIPSAVYKCLVKIGLSVLPKEEMINFKEAINWILCDNHSYNIITPLVLLQAYIPGFKPIKESFIKILKKNEMVSTSPAYWLIIGFGNIVYQIMLPSALDYKVNLDKQFTPLIYDESWPFGNVERNIKKLTSHEIVRGETLTINFSYDRLIEAPELIGKSFSELGIKYP